MYYDQYEDFQFFGLQDGAAFDLCLKRPCDSIDREADLFHVALGFLATAENRKGSSRSACCTLLSIHLDLPSSREARLRLHLRMRKKPFTVQLPHRRVESFGESITIGGKKAIRYNVTSLCVASTDTFVVAVQATHPEMVWDQEEVDQLNSTMTCVVLECWQIPAAAGTANHNLLGKY